MQATENAQHSYPIKEAWLHNYPEKPITSSENLKNLTTLFYGTKENPNTPIGFNKFILSVAHFNRTKAGGPADVSIATKITKAESVYFFNRQTATQIFYRFPHYSEKTGVLDRNPAEIQQQNEKPKIFRTPIPLYRLQLDLFTIPNLASRDVAKNSGESRPKVGDKYFLVIVDVATRFVWCKSVQDQKQKTVANKFVKFLVDEFHPQERQKIKEIMSDAGREFVGNEFRTIVATAFTQDTIPVPRFITVNKSGTLQAHPGSLSPVETAVRSVREYLEKYRRFYPDDFLKTNLFHTDRGLKEVCALYNERPNEAFNNKFSPAEIFNDLQTLQEFVNKSNQQAKRTRSETDEKKLQTNEIVRILRKTNVWSKQSLPKMTYRVFKVMGIAFPNVFVRESDASGNLVDKKQFPVHISRIVRIKTPIMDPPAWSVYAAFIQRVPNDLLQNSDLRLKHRPPHHNRDVYADEPATTVVANNEEQRRVSKRGRIEKQLSKYEQHHA